MRYYYGFQYDDGRRTTSGTPNRVTGQLNIAGALQAFCSQADRNAWVAQSSKRISVTRRDARYLHLGLKQEDWKDYLREVCAEAEE